MLRRTMRHYGLYFSLQGWGGIIPETSLSGREQRFCLNWPWRKIPGRGRAHRSITLFILTDFEYLMRGKKKKNMREISQIIIFNPSKWLQFYEFMLLFRPHDGLWDPGFWSLSGSFHESVRANLRKNKSQSQVVSFCKRVWYVQLRKAIIIESLFYFR